jgi:hypothetical protein
VIVDVLSNELIDSSIMGCFIASDEDWAQGALRKKVEVLL